MIEINELKVSNSSLGMLRSCARKLEFRKFYQHPGYSRSIPGDVGTALHEGYQSYMVDGDRDKALLKMAFAYPIDLEDNPMEPRSLESCVATLDAMMDADKLLEYELATVNCVDGITRPATEVFFEFNINGFSLSDTVNIPVTYIGFIDLILYNHLTDEYVVVDIKTHRDNTKDLTPKYAYSPQCLPYGIVLARMLDKPLEALTVKYMSVYIDTQEPAIGFYEFEKSTQDIQDWAKGLLVDLQQLKTFYKMGWFPRNGNSCVNFRRTCDFFDVCSSRNDDFIQKMILENKEPYHKRDEEPWIICDLDLGIRV